MTTTTTGIEVPADGRTREPKGYLAKYSLASFGLFLAIFAPALGGLSVKIQSLVGLDQAPAALGLVTGVGALFALVAQPLVGRLSDRTMAKWGMRRPWIVVGVVGAFLALVASGLAPNIPILLVTWCAAQLFSNFAQAAETATVADQVPHQRRGVVSGLVGAATPVAILVAAIGLNFLPTDALRFAVPAAVGLVLGLIFALTLKDRVRLMRPEQPFDVKEFFGSFVFNPRTYKSFGWAWLTKAFIMFGYASVAAYLTLFLAVDFGMRDTASQLQFNLIATLVSVVFIVTFSILGGRLSDRLGRRRIFVRLGGIILGVGVLIVAVSPLVGPAAGLTLILAGEVFIGIGGGFFFAVDNALCIDILPNKQNTAKDLGVLNIANTLPQMIAPFLAGTLVIPLGNAILNGFGYTLWFMIAGVVAIIGGILVYRIKGVA
ncbi:MFS transporter [Subtercola lobariae]|uniref:MFS transporter n=1 Tax=Subtercola lobariae TaxID=1588641 RepID=A0A917B7S2_9MICO|nr:MFS transporter [Subtercola lobariae]GGF30398.1 MFS transporter [Subtercola lobariae]